MLISLAILVSSPHPSKAQTTSPPPTITRPGATDSAQIHGFARTGTIPLGGVRVTAASTTTGKRFTTITGGNGAYSISVPLNDRYLVRAVFRTFTSSAEPAQPTPARPDQQVDFSFQMAPTTLAQLVAGTNSLSSLWPPLILPPINISTTSLEPAASSTGGSSGAQFPSFTGDPNFSGDNFVVNGQSPIVTPYFQMADQMRQDFEDGHELQGPSLGPSANPSTQNASSTSPAPSVDSVNLHGALFWTGGNSKLNANPFVLAGQPSPNPSYHSDNFGVTLSGQPFIPGLTRPSPKDSLVVSYSGQLNSSLVNQFGVVPTDLEREGNFSQLVGPTGAPIPIYIPKTNTPYPNNTIDTALSPAALALLQFLPEPNLQSTGLNYRLLTTQGTHANTLGASYTHNFGPAPAASSSATTKITDSQPLAKTLSVNFNLGHVAADVVNIFPELGGKQRIDGYSATAGYTVTKGEWISNVDISESRNNAQVRNNFTNREDIASKVGVYADQTDRPPFSPVPINTNPLNFGLPNLIFNNFTGFSETQPNFQLTQTTSGSGSVSWTHRSHILRFGGDIHRIEFNLFGSTDATGSYIFTGGYTQIDSAPDTNPVPTTGSSFADFLLGLPQQTKLESPGQKAYTRQTNWDAFVRDDWRVRTNLTLTAGLRYDYFAPFVEKYDRLSTLDFNSDFSNIAAVQPDGVGGVSGAHYPRSLVKPDRNNFAPHLGLAWQAVRNTVVRAAYGINYTVGQYGAFVENFAYQPPFAVVQANGNAPHFASPFDLQYGFGNENIIGNYAINQNYRVPYVQVWYLDVQQLLPLGLQLDVGYTGSKGTRLDILSTPGPFNTSPFASAYFDYEDSTAFSKFNALVVRANKRMKNGLALQAIYTYSHSIDNASSTDAGVPVVAQNPQNLLAEESNSSFDIRHQLTGSFLYQLPFGSHKALLNKPDMLAHVFGDWSIAGFFTFAKGAPLTPYISASVAEVERGTHGSVRPDRVPGVSITAGGGKLDHWFNTSAFSSDFAPGQIYGTASRFSIPGPGVENINISLSKQIPLKETRSLEFRITANNAFNIVQYSGVNTEIDSSTFGFVNAVQPMRQITFLALFSF